MFTRMTVMEKTLMKIYKFHILKLLKEEYTVLKMRLHIIHYGVGVSSHNKKKKAYAKNIHHLSL